MRVPGMNFRKRSIGAVVALALAGLSLAGCVVYPDGYGYGGGYAAPAYYAPPVTFGFGYYGGGWGGGGGRWR